MPHLWLFNTILAGSSTLYMGRMRQDTPREALVLFPLRDEEIARVIPYLHKCPSVRTRDILDVRRIDDHPAPSLRNRFNLVHAFPTGPGFVIHCGGTGKYGVESPAGVLYVQLCGEVSRGRPRILRAAKIEPRQPGTLSLVPCRSGQR